MGFLYATEHFVIVKPFVKKALSHPSSQRSEELHNKSVIEMALDLTLLESQWMVFSSHPDAPREGLGMPSLPSDARTPQHELAEHLLTLLVLIHPVIIVKQMAPNYKREWWEVEVLWII